MALVLCQRNGKRASSLSREVLFFFLENMLYNGVRINEEEDFYDVGKKSGKRKS